MLRDVEHEKEILLGNKQLLGIFFLVVILLGVAFGSGYKVGQGSHKTSNVSIPTPEGSSTATSSNAGGETRTIGADNQGTGTNEAASSQTSTEHAAEPAPAANSGSESATEAPLLGGRSRRKEGASSAVDNESAGPAAVTSHTLYAPQAGQTFLQVAAVSKDEAEGIADVLRRKGFHAHSVPKPGSKLYRVIIGPVRDASDLNSTRTSLHNTGFREVFVQRY